METLIELAGWLGAAGILLAYFLNSLGVIEVGKSYQLLNLVGAAGVVWNSVYHAAWPSVGLNGIWAGIALVSLLAVYKRGTESAKRQENPGRSTSVEKQAPFVEDPVFPGPRRMERHE